jgi:hypothetical protein
MRFDLLAEHSRTAARRRQGAPTPLAGGPLSIVLRRPLLNSDGVREVPPVTEPGA